MTKITRGLLAVALLCLAVGGGFNTGLIDAHGIDALYSVLPLGAVFFGLFLIERVLGKETMDQDGQHHESNPEA